MKSKEQSKAINTEVDKEIVQNKIIIAEQYAQNRVFKKSANAAGKRKNTTKIDGSLAKLLTRPIG